MNLDMWRAIISMAVQQARQVTDDQDALKMKVLYKEWDKQIGRELLKDEYVQYNGELYKVLEDHMVQENLAPGSDNDLLYIIINAEE